MKSVEVNKEKSDKVPASVSFPSDLLALIDTRAKELDLNRSQYLRQLVRKDLAEQQPQQVAA